MPASLHIVTIYNYRNAYAVTILKINPKVVITIAPHTMTAMRTCNFSVYCEFHTY